MFLCNLEVTGRGGTGTRRRQAGDGSPNLVLTVRLKEPAIAIGLTGDPGEEICHGLIARFCCLANRRAG